MACTFYLGTHHPRWLGRVDVPLFVSRRTLCRWRAPARATCDWALDSGGFSELSMYGRWTVTPEEYVAEVRGWAEQIGRLRWAAIMDWMCEPWITAKTGLTVREHQRRTVESCLTLNSLAPEQPWVPVLQGWHYDDYLDHAEQYRAAGVRLEGMATVGIGSVCRRQDTAMAEEVIRELAGRGIRLHGFGFKVLGLSRVADALHSADSLAWSYQARRSPRLPGCEGHKNCANCMRYALRWRDRVLGVIDRASRRPRQPALY